MQKLVEGIHHFQTQVFSQHEKLFEQLADGQTPSALFVTCSDSRINPNLLTQTQPGELFILRNAGNIIPPYGAVEGGEAATLEYAVSVLKVQDIVVCGHSHCGAMSALLHPEKVEHLSAVRDWLRHAEATRRIVTENYQHLTCEQERVDATIEENVLVQLENLRTHPSVAAALARNRIRLHAWVYEFETGHVFAYSPTQDDFVPLSEQFQALPWSSGAAEI